MALGRASAALVDEFMEQHAGDHVERFEDAIALVSDTRESGNLHFPVVEEKFHVLDGRRIGQVAFVVLDDVGDVAQVHPERAEVFLHVVEALDILSHFFVLGIGDEDDAIHAAKDELAGRVVDDLAGDGVELEFRFEAFDGHGFDRQEVEEQGAIRAGGQGDEFALFLGGLNILVDFDQVGGLSAHGGTIVDDLDLQFFGGLVDNCHRGSRFALRSELGSDHFQF